MWMLTEHTSHTCLMEDKQVMPYGNNHGNHQVCAETFMTSCRWEAVIIE